MEQVSGAEETGTQTDSHGRRLGHCHKRKFLRRQMEMSDDDCNFRSHHHDKKAMKKMAKKWMKKMMWRRMMFRMSNGGPFGMGFGPGCRRRRMMAAAVMDSTSSDSGDHSAGWRHRRCCRRKFGRRFEDENRQADQTSKKGRKQREDGKEAVGITEGETQNTAVASGSNVDVGIEAITAENFGTQTESGRTPDGKQGRKDHKKNKCMHFCDGSSDSSSDSSSSSSESSSDEGEVGRDKKSRKHGGRFGRGWKHHHHHHHHHHQISAESKNSEKGLKGKKAWKGKKFHKRMMTKGLGRKGHFRRFC